MSDLKAPTANSDYIPYYKNMKGNFYSNIRTGVGGYQQPIPE
jgi:hypothetical protein